MNTYSNFAGLELPIGLLGSSSLKQQHDGAVALYKLADKAMALSPVDAAPPSPTPQVRFFAVNNSESHSFTSHLFIPRVFY